MNSSDPLAQLRDIHLPEPAGWWPPAPGWWFVAISLLIVVIFAIRIVKEWLAKGRFRREARLELKNLIGKQDGMDDREFVEQINILLRRVAVHAYGRERVATLTGRKWLEFLDQTGKTTHFTSGEGEVLAEGHYRPEIRVDRSQLLPLIEKWLGRHHPC
jgi:hypothetical protein